uniref:Uncharacterized protein n=1 Tax=Tanacetum cinerariifolium TaxID=118510 RepID=A0A6L2J3W0_TANCI|nr:hypothetical protein [Tanacetum cinerariifolium]
MVTVPIHQASSSVQSLSIPIIDLYPPKPVSFMTQALIFLATTTLLLPPPSPQQSTYDSELAVRVTTLEQKLTAFEKKSKTLNNKTQNLGSSVFTLDLRDLPHKINQTFLAEKDKSRKRCHNDQEPPPPLLDSDLSKKRIHDLGASESTRPPDPQPSAYKIYVTRVTPFSSSRQQSASHSEQPIEDVPIIDNVNVSDSKDTDTTHLPKLKTRPDRMKLILEEDIPATPKPD